MASAFVTATGARDIRQIDINNKIKKIREGTDQYD